MPSNISAVVWVGWVSTGFPPTAPSNGTIETEEEEEDEEEEEEEEADDDDDEEE